MIKDLFYNSSKLMELKQYSHSRYESKFFLLANMKHMELKGNLILNHKLYNQLLLANLLESLSFYPLLVLLIILCLVSNILNLILMYPITYYDIILAFLQRVKYCYKILKLFHTLLQN